MKVLSQILASVRGIVDAASSRPVDAASSPRLRRVFLPLLPLLSLLCLASSAAETEISFRGQKVYYEGASEVKWVGDPSDPAAELLLIYRSTSGVNTFRASKNATARVLAVAGGGAGGTVRSSAASYQGHSGGGGGGAGELVDRSSVPFAAGATYSFTVGAGGAATGVSGTASAGADGSDSYITADSVDVLRVKGGGGGGGESVGRDGGSGGGGSYKSTTILAGGSASCNETDGQGHDAGSAAKRYAGGGGGAGEAGVNGTDSVGGNGGAGVESDIDPTNVRKYAGGGGGGTTNTGNPGTGGAGGGGTGGKNANTTASDPTAGEANTGSGGGGGGRYRVGAAGGSGIIIIRLTNIESPMEWKAIPVEAGGQKGYIFVDTSAGCQWVNGDLVITYTNVLTGGGLSFKTTDDMTPEMKKEYEKNPPIWANARILAVGGGGGGGLVTTRAGGAGAGGGAGGFVEKSGLVFDNADKYSIALGKGGAGAETALTSGKNGGDTSVTSGGANIVDIAKGGGGGGAHSEGADGGSGGGGSRLNVKDPVTGDWRREGGAGMAGQGFAGGAGIDSSRGAGGGGAGGIGQDGVSTYLKGGDGGAGRSSDISGVEKWYAGGGGGAFMNQNNTSAAKYLGGAGGQGGGGAGAGVDGGASGTELNPVAAEDGAANTGGGGGGGTSHDGATTPAGSGGSGIVIIRLSGFVVRSVLVPTAKGPFTFDGNAHTGVVEFFAYTLSGTPVATNANWYTVTATIDSSKPYEWSDGGKGDRIIRWEINQMPVPNPFAGATPSFVYDAKVHNPVDTKAFPISAGGQVSVDSTGHVVPAGSGMPYCTLSEYKKTDQGEYTARATLVADYGAVPNVTNFVWRDKDVAVSGSSGEDAASPLGVDGSSSTSGEDAASPLGPLMTDRTFAWEITTAPNEIVGLYYDGYSIGRIGSADHHPSQHYSCAWGKSTAQYYYCEADPNGVQTGDWVDWGSTGPTKKGNYRLKVVIPEPTPKNWEGDEAEVAFGAWDKLSDLYSDRVEITVSGNTSSSTLNDFPVPVKFWEPENDGYEPMSGFSFLRAGPDGTEIHFFDGQGDPIPHEVERWSARCTKDSPAVVWVKVPKLTGVTTKLTACWRRVGDIMLPAYNPTAVWNTIYAGVWHMSKLENGRIPDSTGNNRSAYFTGGSQYEQIEGQMGKAIYLKSGDMLADLGDDWPYKAGTSSNNFAFSGWYEYKDFASGATIAYNDNKTPAHSGYRMFAGTKYGAETLYQIQYNPGWAIRMNNTANNASWLSSGERFDWNSMTWTVNTSWGFVAYRSGYKTPSGTSGPGVARYYDYPGGTAAIYASETTSNDKNHFVNGNDNQLQLAASGFYVDEVRLATNSLKVTKAWLQEEYNSMNKSDYCTFSSLIRIDCDTYNEGMGLLCDYWTTVPSLGKTIWHYGEGFPTENKGTYKSASGITASYKNMKTGEVVTSHPTAIGYYRATYDHSSTASYRDQAYYIDFYIIEKVDPTHDIVGNGGDSGRVLLMNADTVQVSGQNAAVTNQGWCTVNDTSGVTFWRLLEGTAGDGWGNVMGGTSFELNRTSDGATLWRLFKCRQGNLFPTNNTDTIPTRTICLPAPSETSLAITNETVKAKRADAGWILMQNVRCDDDVTDPKSDGAAIYSPCYSNGIGTIYFDAVNSTNAVGACFNLVLEVATATSEGLAPVDTNCWTETSPGTTNLYGRLFGMWQPVEMYPSRYRNGSFADLSATNVLALTETIGGATKYFYRVHAPVNVHKPCRFRLRRMTEDTNVATNDTSYLLVDNVIASVPTVCADLKPYGEFDPELRGPEVVGQAGAFDSPFPAPSELGTLKGRCHVELPTGAAEYAGKNPDEYISLAQMFYRWRYLGTYAKGLGADDWNVATLKGAGEGTMMRTENPLVLPTRPGDIEYYFLTVMKAPFYGYVDYTGLNIGVCKAGYTEEEPSHETHYEKPAEVPRLASDGTDWFTRIREARSDYERMSVVFSGASFTNEVPMQLVEDHVWRAAVKIPEDAKGTCRFSFVGLNRQASGSTTYAANTNTWGVTEVGEIKLPANGVLSETGAPGEFTVDHIANYIEFKIRSDANPTWSASRAEYQNFNDWHDVWSSPTDQSFSIGTNGVDDVAMKKATADMSTWNVYESTQDAWNEPFTPSDDPGYPKDIFYQQHKTPQLWDGYNLTFVSKYLVSYDNRNKTSQMAAKLLGGGDGKIEFNKAGTPGTDIPNGLEYVSYSARLGQSLDFETISFASENAKKKNYLFLAPVSMSRAMPTDAKGVVNNAALGDMAVGAAVSLYAYYRPTKGCYEYRVTRVATGTEVMMELYKWHIVDGAMKGDRLCGQRMNSDGLVLWNASGEIEGKTTFYGFFISVKNATDEKTGKPYAEIYGGVGKDAQQPTAEFSGSGTAGAPNGYSGLWYRDEDADRLVSGSYGVGAKDCPAQFLCPRHYDAPLASVSSLAECTTYPATTKANGKYYRCGSNKNLTLGTTSVDDQADIEDDWWEVSPQMEAWKKSSHVGLRTPIDRSQQLLLKIQPKAGGDWETVGSSTVKGYSFSSFTIPLYLAGTYNVQLVTGSDAMDVVVGAAYQAQWTAADHERIASGKDLFVYTKGVVCSNALTGVRETVLQPARGVATKAMSVRSPLLRGLGKVTFSYADADDAAELWVQVATNAVQDNITGTGGYNDSIKSVDAGEQAGIGTWVTVAKYGASDDCVEPLIVKGVRSGVKTIYLGWHDLSTVPKQGGLFRVFVPPSIVEKAITEATGATKNATYGKVTVTGMTVTDEPAVSSKGWRGWNLRTVGDLNDQEARMFLSDSTQEGDIGNGLVCALNNSLNDLKSGTDLERAATRLPAIWSPTFTSTNTTERRMIGSVTFKARLYYGNDVCETATGGVVTVWGTTSTSDVPSAWTKVKEFHITSSVFSNFTWAANGAQFTAVKFEISDPNPTTETATRDRVLLDEIVMCEKVQGSINFLYVRPFRTHLFDPVEIADIKSMNQQPLVGESWGVQTKLAVSQMEGEVSDMEVYLTTFTGKKPWGYGQWKTQGTKPVKLTFVGDSTNLVYRSVGTDPNQLVKPVNDPNTVVQYMLVVKFKQSGEGGTESIETPVESWEQPAWYSPVDYNETYGGYDDPTKFSLYTILDNVSPGRAWINEVNYNDGADQQNTNQFIEICVPSGVDMSGWYLRATDKSFNEWIMAEFGQYGVPKSKISPNGTNGFEFVVLESPNTNYKGGIHAPDGTLAADGTWGSDGPAGSAPGGTLNYSHPFQFELIRPSGVVEHQIVLQGTNEWWEYSFGEKYTGTNLVMRLNEQDYSAKRFYAAEETENRRNGAWLGSAGVVGGKDDGNPAPGADGTWTNGMAFTAGRLNEGQIIPANWFLSPNGTNAWVYLYVNGSHISQNFDGDTNRAMMVILPQGTRTNVTYTAEPWYEVATVTTASGKTQHTDEVHRRGTWSYDFTPTGTVTITANEGVDAGLAPFNIGFGEGYSAYSRAVVKWLHDEYPDATPEDIRLPRYMNLNRTDVVTNLTLTEAYWLDIPPVNSEGNASDKSEWWFRGGFTGIRVKEYERQSYNGVINTNSQFDVCLYISNDFNTAIAPYAPKRLQGLNNEKSDTYASGAWTSVTFKISGMLINGEEGNKGYLPFRLFTFGEGSFTGPSGDATLDPPLGPFSSRIEILDPFSTSSPGYSYGWSHYPNTTPFWFKWTIDTKEVPTTVETLKTNDIYEDVE